MADLVLTAEQFKDRYPEFSAVDDSYITTILDEAVLEVDDSWIEKFRVPAALAYAAHLLSLAGEPGRTESGEPSSPQAVKKIKVGDVETEFVTGGNSGGGAGSEYYMSTSYGQTFWRYLRRSFPAVAIV